MSSSTNDHVIGMISLFVLNEPIWFPKYSLIQTGLSQISYSKSALPWFKAKLKKIPAKLLYLFNMEVLCTITATQKK